MAMNVERIADSPALGMEFCAGCWLEGGAAFGDVLAGVRELAEQDRILLVHFRNISAPLPHFVETFLDNGYMDMYRIMRVLVETGLIGLAIFLAFQFSMLADMRALFKSGASRFFGIAGLFTWITVFLYNVTQDSLATPNLWINLGILIGLARTFINSAGIVKETS